MPLDFVVKVVHRKNKEIIYQKTRVTPRSPSKVVLRSARAVQPPSPGTPVSEPFAIEPKVDLRFSRPSTRRSSTRRRREPGTTFCKQQCLPNKRYWSRSWKATIHTRHSASSRRNGLTHQETSKVSNCACYPTESCVHIAWNIRWEELYTVIVVLLFFFRRSTTSEQRKIWCSCDILLHCLKREDIEGIVMVVRMNKRAILPSARRCKKSEENKFSSSLDRFPNQDSNRPSLIAIGWDGETCKRMDKLAPEDHTYVATYAQRERYCNTLGINLNQYSHSSITCRP